MVKKSHELRHVKSLLNTPGKNISDLTGRELKVYFDYRLANLVRERLILTNSELQYLLAETGQGSRRFDNETLALLLSGGTVVQESARIALDIDKLRLQKEMLSEKLLKSSRSENVAATIIGALKGVLGPLEIMSESPLLLKGSVHRTGFLLYWNNGGWVSPDKDLFAILSHAHQENLIPIVIAKKIHGILFPLFKAIGATGFNTYVTIIGEEVIPLYNQTNKKLERAMQQAPLFSKLSFNGQFGLTDDIIKDPGSALFDYLTTRALPAVAASSFLKNKFIYEKGFDECIKSIGGMKLKTGLATWSRKHKGQMASLRRLK